MSISTENLETADEELFVRRGSSAFVAMVRFLGFMQRHFPKLTQRMVPSRASMPRFRDLMRIAEDIPVLPDLMPAENPAGILRRFPELAKIRVEDIEAQGPHGPVACRVYHPETDPVAGLAWIHGGAFVLGDLDAAEANWTALKLAQRGIVVVNISYRKALHGVHYPVPLDDCLAGWQWASAHTDRLRIAAADLHLGGASAGGALAAGLAKKLRDDAKATRPRSLTLAYPYLHGGAVPWEPGVLDDVKQAAPGRMFDDEDLDEMMHNFAGRRSVLSDPYAIPANGDLGDLPPTFVLTAECDSLRRSAELFAEALGEAGGTVTVEQQPGAGHGSLALADTDDANSAVNSMAGWILGEGRGSR